MGNSNYLRKPHARSGEWESGKWTAGAEVGAREGDALQAPRRVHGYVSSGAPELHGTRGRLQ